MRAGASVQRRFRRTVLLPDGVKLTPLTGLAVTTLYQAKCLCGRTSTSRDAPQDAAETARREGFTWRDGPGWSCSRCARDRRRLDAM